MSKGDVLVGPEIKLWLIMSNYSKAFLKAGVINDPGKYQWRAIALSIAQRRSWLRMLLQPCNLVFFYSIKRARKQGWAATPSCYHQPYSLLIQHNELLLTSPQTNGTHFQDLHQKKRIHTYFVMSIRQGGSLSIWRGHLLGLISIFFVCFFNYKTLFQGRGNINYDAVKLLSKPVD